MDASTAKAAFRREFRQKLAAQEGGRVEAETRALLAHLSGWTLARGFEVLLATLPLPGEPDLTPLLQQWLASGKAVALARTGPVRQLEFRYVRSLEGPWETRAYGLREPLADATLWQPCPATLALVPGLAFAPATPEGCWRLGRGGGYYDSWLATNGHRVCALGVAFSVQVCPQVPRQPHDQRLHGWADASGIHGLRG